MRDFLSKEVSTLKIVKLLFFSDVIQFLDVDQTTDSNSDCITNMFREVRPLRLELFQKVKTKG